MPNQGENKQFFSPLLIAAGSVFLILLALGADYYIPSLECPIKAQWNIDCPGCGGTRATKHLITGDIPSALSFNPLISSGIILVTVYCLFSLICRLFTGKYYPIKFSLTKGIIFLVVIAVFTIVRNL